MRRPLVLGLILTILASVVPVSAQTGWVLWRYVQMGPAREWTIVESTVDQPGCLTRRDDWLRTGRRNPRKFEEMVEAILPGKVHRSQITDDGMWFVTTRDVEARFSYHCFQAGVQPR